MSIGYISIGSNIDKAHNIRSSLKALSEHFGDIQTSSVYETEPVGFQGESFYNLIVRFSSVLSAKQVAKILKQIEVEHGRSHDSQKFSSRTLDLDLILYDAQIIDDGRLQVPRDEIERYAFVLEPLAEIAGQQKHPISGKTYDELWLAFDKTNLHRTVVMTPEDISGK